MDLPKLDDTLKFDEGARRLPNGRHRMYTDSEGNYTVGWGHLVSNGFSDAVADLMLTEDREQAVHDCETFPWFAGLSDVRQRVLAEMSFALGLPRLQGFRKMLAACAAGDFDLAADELLDSKWASQVGDRAIRLAEMLRSGVDTLV